MSKSKAELFLMKLPRFLLFPVTFIAKLLNRKVIFWFSHDRDVYHSKDASYKVKIANFFYDQGLRLSSLIISQTNYQKRKIKKRGLKAHTVRSLVNQTNILELTSESQKPYILWVGRYDKINLKRVHIVFFIAKLLPDFNFRIICQTDSDKRRTSLKKKASEFTNVDFLGQVDYESMGFHFYNSTALLCTSFSEGFPNTYLQSWSHGKPVFSLSVNPDNIISANELGFSSNGNVLNLIEAIKINLKNKEKLSEYKGNSLNYIEKEHNFKKLIPKYIKIFDRILK